MLGFIPIVSKYEKLTDGVLRAYLDEKAEKSKKAVNLKNLYSIVRKHLKMDVKDRSAMSRMEYLFARYVSILRRNGLTWLLKDNQRISATHVLSTVKPKSLQERLNSDLNFTNYDPRNYFKGLLEHAIRISEALEIVDNGFSAEESFHKPNTGVKAPKGNKNSSYSQLKNQNVP